MRRSVSDPDPNDPSDLEGPCSFKHGLRSAFPEFEFRIVDERAREARRARRRSLLVAGGRGEAESVGESVGESVAENVGKKKKKKGSDKAPGLGFGLLTDYDAMWKPNDRESQKHQVSPGGRRGLDSGRGEGKGEPEAPGEPPREGGGLDKGRGEREGGKGRERQKHRVKGRM